MSSRSGKNLFKVETFNVLHPTSPFCLFASTVVKQRPQRSTSLFDSTMDSPTSDVEASFPNTPSHHDDDEDDPTSPPMHDGEQESIKKTKGDEAPDISNVSIKELLRRKRKRRGMKMMPSTVKRLEERKRQRLALKKKSKPQESDNLSQDNRSTRSTGSKSAVPSAKSKPPDDDNNNESTSPTGNNTATQDEGAAAAAADDDDDGGVVAPQVRIDENGEIVIDQSSLFVPATNSNSNDDQFTGFVSTIEDGRLGSHISSASFKKRESSSKWSSAESARFYEALRTFGTDFSLMTKLFPHRSRRQLKYKFKREERENPNLVDEALNGPRKPIPAVLPTVPTAMPTTSTEQNGQQKNTTATTQGPGKKEKMDESRENDDESGNKSDSDGVEKAKEVQQPDSSKPAAGGAAGSGGGGDEIVGRVSDDEEDMLATYEEPGEDMFEEDDGGFGDMDSDDD